MPDQNGDDEKEIYAAIGLEALKLFVTDVRKLTVDMYRGDGKNNPSMTTRVAALESDMTAIGRDWFGNGKPGLRDTLIAFMTDSKARDEEREKQVVTQQEEVKAAVETHNIKITSRYNFLIVVIAALALVVAWLTYVDTHNGIKAGTLKLPHFPTATHSDPPQDAKKEKLFAF